MKQINLDAVACPSCGTSGKDNLNADSQIEYTGRVDGDGWISCPDCGCYAEFDEDGEVTKTNHHGMEWQAQMWSLLDPANA